MSPLSIFAIPVIVVFGCFSAAQGRWGPAGCSSVEGRVVRQMTPAYRWVLLDGRKDVMYLYRGDQGIGYYSFNTGFYRRVIGGTYGAPEICPTAPPFDLASNEQTRIYTGVEPQKISPRKRYMVGGTEVTEDQAFGLVEGALRDDSKSPHLTVIDKDPARRKQAGEDFSRARAGTGDTGTVRFQVYDPSLVPNKAILAPFHLDKDTKFQQGGRVMLAQASAAPNEPATVTNAWYDGFGVPEMTEALRKLDPFWNPNKPWLPDWPSFPTIPWEWILGGGVLLALVIFAARANKP